MVDYSCVEFGDCTFSSFGFIVRADKQTNKQTNKHCDTDTQSHTDAANRYTRSRRREYKQLR